MKKITKIISLMLSIAMLVSFTSATAFAKNTTIDTCNDVVITPYFDTYSYLEHNVQFTLCMIPQDNSQIEVALLYAGSTIVRKLFIPELTISIEALDYSSASLWNNIRNIALQNIASATEVEMGSVVLSSDSGIAPHYASDAIYLEALTARFGNEHSKTVLSGTRGGIPAKVQEYLSFSLSAPRMIYATSSLKTVAEVAATLGILPSWVSLVSGVASASGLIPTGSLFILTDCQAYTAKTGQLFINNNYQTYSAASHTIFIQGIDGPSCTVLGDTLADDYYISEARFNNSSAILDDAYTQYLKTK